MRGTSWRALLAGAAAIAVCTTSASAQSANEFEFSLPAQDLSDSLRAVSLQSGRSIVVSGDLVRGRRAPGVSGPLTVEEAVARLLEGTGLEARRVGEALVIVNAGGGERPVPAELAGGSEEGDGTIVVTGTHLRGAPASSPMIVIDREAIDRTGATSVEQLMRKLPQNSQAGVNQENFGVALPDQDVTDHGAGVNLRGLGQRATLVLVDGRRLAPSGYGAYVDVSLVPLSLIERVEVLTDGASAIYGSDAVGGVVNFILRDRLDGIEAAVQGGLATRGGGEQLMGSLAGGAEWQGGHGLLAYEYRQEDEITAGDRSFTVDLPPDTFLLPRERRQSVLASAGHELAEGLELAAVGTYAHRSTDRTYFQSVSPLPVQAEASAESVTLSGELSYELGGAWRARLEGNFALSDSAQRQIQPGGLELANARDVRNEVVGGSFKVDGPLTSLPGGPVRMALGAELRHETYRDGFESETIPLVVNEDSRDVRSLFGELSLPLVGTGNRSAGVERLEVSVAGRFDDYSGTGSNFDPKIGVLWEPVEGLSLRGSYGTSFRAPLLSETGGNYNVLYLPAWLVYQDPTEPAPDAIVALLQGSNPDVRPETSRTWSAGADYTPAFAPGLSVSLNYYSIRFADRIALPARFIVVVGDPAFEPIIDRSPDVAELTDLVAGAQLVFDATGPGFSNGGATPADVDIVLDDRVSNTAETTTSGLDLAVRYAFDLDASRIEIDAMVNHVLSFDDRLTRASPLAQAVDRLYGPLSWRARGGANWSRGAWGASLYVNYAGPYEDDRAPKTVPVSAWTTFDLSASYTFGAAAGWFEGTSVSLYAENLFDADPPRVLPDAGSGTGLGYDPVNAAGRGRFVSLQLRARW